MVAIKAERERGPATIWTDGSRLGNGDAGGGFLTWDPREATPVVPSLGVGVGRGTRGKIAWTYSMRRRSRLDRPPAPGWVGVGSRPGCRREAYDAEIIAIFRGLQSLVERPEKELRYTIFTDPQAAMPRPQEGAPGPGQGLATQIIRTAKHPISTRGTR